MKKYNDYNLEEVDFHSLSHLSTHYKLKITQGDLKTVQGDIGHAEADMVMEIYTRVIDEDRRNNAIKLENCFYTELSALNCNSACHLTDTLKGPFTDQQALADMHTA